MPAGQQFLTLHIDCNYEETIRKLSLLFWDMSKNLISNSNSAFLKFHCDLL